jgi:hypothetical protein
MGDNAPVTYRAKHIRELCCAIEAQAEEIARLTAQKDEWISEGWKAAHDLVLFVDGNGRTPATAWDIVAEMRAASPGEYLDFKWKTAQDAISAERERDALKVKNERLRGALQGLLTRAAEPDEEYGPEHAVTVARAALNHEGERG